jgi:hypothetical protein
MKSNYLIPENTLLVMSLSGSARSSEQLFGLIKDVKSNLGRVLQMITWRDVCD